MGVFAMKPMGGGHLMSSNREALTYALSNPLLDSVAIGMQSIEEIDANVDFLENLPEAAQRQEQLQHRKREMMVHDYCEGCHRMADLNRVEVSSYTGKTSYKYLCETCERIEGFKKY